VIVEIAGEAPARLAGLYAEGRVEATASNALTVPDSAVVREGERAFAWRLNGKALQKVALKVGERDLRSGDYVIRAGVADGDKLLRHPIATLKDGQPVKDTPSAVAASPTPAAETAK
jgi:membrane fusion protein, multidrug efflux system